MRGVAPYLLVVGIASPTMVDVAAAAPGTPESELPACDGSESENLPPASEASPEVVCVKARREFERAQDVPISLTAVSGYRLDSNGVNSLLRLNQLVPSLQILSFNPRNTSITIRGLGANIAIVNDGIEAGVGVYVDGVFYARPAQSLFDLPNIASVEVLRGPQGTLYGKNSVAGAVNINTYAPSSTFESSGTVSVGNYGFKQFAANVAGPLRSDGKVNASLSAMYTDRDGFSKNVFTGQRVDDYDDYSLRGQLALEASPNLSLRIIADYSDYDALRPVRFIGGVVTTLRNGQAVPRNFFQRSAAAGYVPLPIDPYARQTDTNSPTRSSMAQGGVSSELDWLVQDFTLTSISSYRSWKWRPRNDDDVTALSVLTQSQLADDERQVTQEVRVASPAARTLTFSVGLNYFWEQVDSTGSQQFGSDAPIWLLGSASPIANATLNGFGITGESVLRINSYAAYGQATWHVRPDLELTGGLRYTYEYKTGGYFQRVAGPPISSFTLAQQSSILATRATLAIDDTFSVAASNSLLGGIATLSYHVSDHIMAYATYSHGEKSAGLNLTSLTGPLPKVVAPEAVDNYEVGLKSTLLDSRITFNADVFWMQDSNYQTTLLDPTRFSMYLANIPAVRSRGFEVDVDGNIFEGFTALLSAAYTDAIYESYPNAPAPFEDYTVVAGRLNTNITEDLSNRSLPATSKWAVSVGAEYFHTLGSWGLSDLEAYAGIDEAFRSSYFTTANLSLYSSIPAYDVMNLRVGVRSENGRWDLQFWSRNVLDRNYKITQAPLIFNSGALSTMLGDPRTVGGTLTVRY